MCVLVTLCDREGERVIESFVLDVKPSIGETMTIHSAHNRIQSYKILDISHHVNSKNCSRKDDPRVFIMLDVDKEDI